MEMKERQNNNSNNTNESTLNNKNPNVILTNEEKLEYLSMLIENTEKNLKHKEITKNKII